MKKLYKMLFVACFIITFLIGIMIGAVSFSRIKVIGEQKLQNYIDNVTNEHIKLFEENGFKVNQSYIIGVMWIQCGKLGDFIMMAYIFKIDTIYLHWKIDFLRQPVFYILANKSAITYEPF